MEAETDVVDRFSRRRAAGAVSRDRTRRALLAAADELFRGQGYTATTVQEIASRADVSLQTLYLAWGSKSALFRAAADAAAAASELPVTPQAWQETLRERLHAAAGPSPTTRAYLLAVAELFVEVAERTSAYWQMQAAAADADIAVGHAAAMRARRDTMAAVAGDLPRGGLRPGVDDDTVLATMWSLASPEVFALLTTQAGYTPARFRDWLERTLVTALCPDEDPGRSA